MNSPPPSLGPGTVLQGKYRVDAPLGQGGMGVVWRATHLMLEQPVAIKVLHDDQRTDARAVERMTREARAAAATGHRNICRVADLGDDGGNLFFVMELVEGETFEAMADRGPLSVDLAVDLVGQLLQGLAAVHARGLVHRDLKPQNVMVTRDAAGERLVKILDFGLVKPVEPGQCGKITQEGAIVGTPAFMAPEQAHGLPLDLRADLYACGVILYTLLVGREPFVAKTALGTLSKVLAGEYEPASTRSLAIPEVFDQVVAKAMAASPARRYASADAMRDDLLSAHLHGEAPRARSFATGPPPENPARPDERPASQAGPTAEVVAPVVEHESLGLELDLPNAPESSSSPEPRHGAGVKAGAARRRAATIALGLAAAGGLAWVTWQFDLIGGLTLRDPPGDTAAAGDGRTDTTNDLIGIKVATRPASVEIFVDEVRHDERPVKVQRSDEYVRVRVQAAGHHSKTIQLVPSTDRRLDVVLTRK